MDEQTYLEERLESQYAWHNSKSSKNQKQYKRLRYTVIVLSVSIPFLSGYLTTFSWVPIVIGLMGVMISICEGALGLNKYYENWTQYRMVAEQLRSERIFFETRKGPYSKVDDPFDLLVRSVEGILNKENLSWADRVKED